MVMGKAALFVEPYHFEITELPAVPVEAGGIRVKIKTGRHLRFRPALLAW